MHQCTSVAGVGGFRGGYGAVEVHCGDKASEVIFGLFIFAFRYHSINM